MNFIDRAFSILGYTKGAFVSKPPRWVSEYSEANHFWEPDPGEADTQISLYTKVSWVMSAVNLVASVAATTPLKVKNLDDDGNKDIDNHPFEQLLRRPNPHQSRHEFLYASMSWSLITGNCYWWLNRDNEDAEPDEIWIIPTRQMRPVPNTQNFISGYLYNPGNGIEIPIDAHEVCHFANFNPTTMYVGMSPLESLYNTATQDFKANEWNKNFFAKDNAKPTGIMTFAEPIDPHSWETIKDTVKAEYGGTKQRLMMLQSVGKGAVRFLPTRLTQSEMQFLDSRKFNRDEIFNAIAVGAASMVDVNATEANSKTGRDIFFSIGVHPKLDFMAQKISADILPVYGDGLICQFDDVRQRDIALELQQIDKFAAVHTIDEVRQEWYSNEPLGDERGDMLVAQIGQGSIGDDEESEPQEPQPLETPDGDGVEEQLKALMSEVKSLKAQSTPPALPPATTVTINQSAPDATSQVVEPEQITGPTLAEADLSLWQTKANNRAKKSRSVAVPFESEHLSNAVKAFVSFGLDRGDMDVFDSAKMLLQLDPDDDEAVEEVLTTLENKNTDAIEKALNKHKAEITNEAKVNGADAAVAVIATSLIVKEVLRKAVIEAADLGVALSVAKLDSVGVFFDWTLVHTEAREWANQYAGEQIGHINNTTRKQVQAAVSAWFDNGEPLNSLIRELNSLPAFNRSRAELVGITESTNAASEGSILSYMKSGVLTRRPYKYPTRDSHQRCRCRISVKMKDNGEWVYVWLTANDEIVRQCPTCWPLHNTEQ